MSEHEKLVEFLKFIGVTWEHGIEFPVYEGDSYIKFMSHNMETDVKQCDQFEEWLKSQNCASYDRHRDRGIRDFDQSIVDKINTKAEELWPELDWKEN